MFKLNRLEITGFKSFADYTEIVFTGNGITAVVGPNGCGKSNVSDAISWVLGEQSPKTLRGQEMKDVVFQGTSKRNPGGMAEVVLHLQRDGEILGVDESELEEIDEKLGAIDEMSVDVDALEAEHLEEEEEEDSEAVAEVTEAEEEVEEMAMVQAAQVGSVKTIKTKTKRRWKPRSFALDFAPGEAVTVTRRLYLSGESEYLLNDKTCRLRDIQDLFAGTGLSGAHYAIIEQGRIGRILSSKPSDRRALIEEAAGISKFKTRQRAAESRLESAKTNLGRISDIVEEIEKRTRSLRRQANKTRRYKVLKEELRDLQTKTYAVEARNLNEAVKELGAKLENARKEEKGLSTFVEEKENRLKEATKDARFAEEALTALRAKHAENALERDRAEREKRYQEEQRSELKQRIEDLDTEVKVTEARVEGLNEEIATTKAAAAAETEAAALERSKLGEAEEKYRGILEQVKAIESRLERERADHLQHTAAVERLSEIGRQFETDLERSGERVKGLEHEKDRANETLRKRREEAKEVKELLELEKGKLESSKKEKKEVMKSCESARTNLEKAEHELNALEKEYSRKRHRLEALEEMEQTGAIYEPSVQKLLASGKDLGVKLLGTLADRFKTTKTSDKAVESLFGSYLQSVIVATRKDAIRVVKYLNKNGMGRIPILVADQRGLAENSSANPEIVKMLGIGTAFASILTDAFPERMTAEVADHVEDVTGVDSLVVTMDGDLVFGGKLFVSGSKGKSEKNTSLLGFKREMRELKSAMKTGDKETAGAAKKVQQVRAELKKFEDSLVDLQSYIVQLEREVLSREIQSTSVAQEIDRSERHRKIVEDELAQLSGEAENIEDKRREALVAAENAELARIESGKKIDKTSLDLAESRKVLDTENIAFNEKRTFAEVAAERMRAAVSALERVNSEKEELENRKAKLKTEIEANTKRKSELEQRTIELAERLVKAGDEIEEESNELTEAVAHLKAAREGSDEMSRELAELNTKAAEARDNRAGIEVRNAELNTRLENVEANCSHDLGVELPELLENTVVDDDFEFDEALERVEYLRNRLDNFGAINMLAVEELAETEERLEFLTSQRQDVEDSIESAEAALREIKRRSRERFRSAFKSINENFTKFFSELFGGGQGEMQLLESEDVLDAGIEIVAQPPGKKLQNMLLLSGGEKAMTAIAMVLAIFKYRPSPFCLLDEVDAPLDDANVGRFVDRIESMSENTQFIVITHNKRTMEAARALYGVTMQEPGVSKVVSVRFD
ncbi:MAG: chromosome segregation protein SMC [Pyrinomonadaceae bacterium]|nr:chromosome segregation protein SMC [Pyrinomonadaceae bacterium]